MPSPLVGRSRDVLVYLPPGYADRPERRFPVLYFQDGQNLFDGATSFVPGQEWELDETAEALIRGGRIAPLIVVAVDHAGAQRIDEYTPGRDPGRRSGGGADLYGRMLVEELKPFVDREYRTRPGPEDTGLGGSSLGGLVTMHLGMTRPDVFSRLAVMSPSVWWNHRALVAAVEALPERLPLKIWLDVGTAEGRAALRDVRRLRDALVAHGWTLGADLQYAEAEGADHSERAWGARAGDVLRYLFPPE